MARRALPLGAALPLHSPPCQQSPPLSSGCARGWPTASGGSGGASRRGTPATGGCIVCLRDGRARPRTERVRVSAYFFFSPLFRYLAVFFLCVHVVSRDPPCGKRRLMASATRHVCSSGEGGRGDGAGGVIGEHTPRPLGLAYHTTSFLHMSMPEASPGREPRGPLCSRPAPERRSPPCADHSVGVCFTNRSLPHPPVVGVAGATGGEGSTARPTGEPQPPCPPVGGSSSPTPSRHVNAGPPSFPPAARQRWPVRPRDRKSVV